MGYHEIKLSKNQKYSLFFLNNGLSKCCFASCYKRNEVLFKLYEDANTKFTEDTRIEEIIKNIKHVKINTTETEKGQNKYHVENIIDLDSEESQEESKLAYS